MQVPDKVSVNVWSNVGFVSDIHNRETVLQAEGKIPECAQTLPPPFYLLNLLVSVTRFIFGLSAVNLLLSSLLSGMFH